MLLEWNSNSPGVYFHVIVTMRRTLLLTTTSDTGRRSNHGKDPKDPPTAVSMAASRIVEEVGEIQCQAEVR
jgi:hypothetical protein